MHKRQVAVYLACLVVFVACVAEAYDAALDASDREDVALFARPTAASCGVVEGEGNKACGSSTLVDAVMTIENTDER
jgi:hypothetical protein